MRQWLSNGELLLSYFDPIRIINRFKWIVSNSCAHLCVADAMQQQNINRHSLLHHWKTKQSSFLHHDFTFDKEPIRKQLPNDNFILMIILACAMLRTLSTNDILGQAVSHTANWLMCKTSGFASSLPFTIKCRRCCRLCCWDFKQKLDNSLVLSLSLLVTRNCFSVAFSPSSFLLFSFGDFH